MCMCMYLACVHADSYVMPVSHIHRCPSHTHIYLLHATRRILRSCSNHRRHRCHLVHRPLPTLPVTLVFAALPLLSLHHRCVCYRLLPAFPSLLSQDRSPIPNYQPATKVHGEIKCFDRVSMKIYVCETLRADGICSAQVEVQVGKVVGFGSVVANSFSWPLARNLGPIGGCSSASGLSICGMTASCTQSAAPTCRSATPLAPPYTVPTRRRRRRRRRRPRRRGRCLSVL